MKNKKKICLVIALVLLLGVGVFAFIYSHSSNPKEENTEAVQESTEVVSSSLKTPEVSQVEKEKPKKTDVPKAAKEELKENLLAEIPEAAEFQVTAYEQVKTMYASGAVNVRKGPGKKYELTGSLHQAQEVTVTGQADTGWYEILYQEAAAYVSNAYLQEELPSLPTPAPVQPQAEAKQNIAPKNHASVIFVGDSRTVQMQEAVGENPYTWICKGGKGYSWLKEEAVTRIENNIGKGTKIVLLLGVNDANHYPDYLELLNSKAPEWTNAGATVYFSSCNQVWENPYTTEEEVETFNTQMQTGLCGEVRWIDSFGYLATDGYRLVDGLHFDAGTSVKLYQFYLNNI